MSSGWEWKVISDTTAALEDVGSKRVTKPQTCKLWFLRHNTQDPLPHTPAPGQGELSRAFSQIIHCSSGKRRLAFIQAVGLLLLTPTSPHTQTVIKLVSQPSPPSGYVREVVTATVAALSWRRQKARFLTNTQPVYLYTLVFSLLLLEGRPYPN